MIASQKREKNCMSFWPKCGGVLMCRHVNLGTQLDWDSKRSTSAGDQFIVVYYFYRSNRIYEVKTADF